LNLERKPMLDLVPTGLCVERKLLLPRERTSKAAFHERFSESLCALTLVVLATFGLWKRVQTPPLHGALDLENLNANFETRNASRKGALESPIHGTKSYPASSGPDGSEPS
jgi:hypothetical protein